MAGHIGADGIGLIGFFIPYGWAQQISYCIAHFIPTKNSCIVQASAGGMVFKTTGNPVNSQNDAVASIAVVLFACNEADIPRLVISIVIDSVNFQPWFPSTRYARLMERREAS